jgi:hypothetical protein
VRRLGERLPSACFASPGGGDGDIDGRGDGGVDHGLEADHNLGPNADAGVRDRVVDVA